MTVLNALPMAVLATMLAASDAPKPGPDPRDEGPSSIDVSSYPAEQQRNYEIYAARCATCHPLARSINAKFSAQDWKKYMKRMVRRENSSGISESDTVAIYRFLKFRAAKLGY